MLPLAKLDALFRPFFYLDNTGRSNLAQLPSDVLTDHIFPKLTLTDLILIANVHPRLHKLASKALIKNSLLCVSLNSFSHHTLIVGRMPVIPQVDLTDGQSVVLYSALHNAVEVWNIPLAKIVAFHHLPPNYPFPSSVGFSASGNLTYAVYRNGVDLYALSQSPSSNPQSEMITLSSITFSASTSPVHERGVRASIGESRVVAALSKDEKYLAAAHIQECRHENNTSIIMKCALVDAQSAVSYADDKGWPVSCIPTKESRETWTMTQTVSKKDLAPEMKGSSRLESKENCPKEMVSTITVQASSSFVCLANIVINADPFRILVPPRAIGDVGFLLDPSNPKGDSRFTIPTRKAGGERVFKICFSECGQYLFVVRVGHIQQELASGDFLISLTKLHLASSQVAFTYDMNLDRQHRVLDVLFSGDARLAVTVIGQEHETSCVVQGWVVLDVVAGGRILVSKSVETTDEYDNAFSISEDGQELCFPRQKVLSDRVNSLQIYATATGQLLGQIENDVEFDHSSEFLSSAEGTQPWSNGCINSFLKKRRGVVSVTRSGGSFAFSTCS